MKSQKLTESESRYLADAIADEMLAMRLNGRINKPQETRRCIRARVLNDIITQRETVKTLTTVFPVQWYTFSGNTGYNDAINEELTTYRVFRPVEIVPGGHREKFATSEPKEHLKRA